MDVEGPVGGVAEQCEPVLRTLPLWFGIEASLLEYVRDTERFPTFAARVAGEVFPTLWGPRLPVLQLVKALREPT